MVAATRRLPDRGAEETPPIFTRPGTHEDRLEMFGVGFVGCATPGGDSRGAKMGPSYRMF